MIYLLNCMILSTQWTRGSPWIARVFHERTRRCALGQRMLQRLGPRESTWASTLGCGWHAPAQRVVRGAAAGAAAGADGGASRRVWAGRLRRCSRSCCASAEKTEAAAQALAVWMTVRPPAWCVRLCSPHEHANKPAPAPSPPWTPLYARAPEGAHAFVDSSRALDQLLFPSNP